MSNERRPADYRQPPLSHDPKTTVFAAGVDEGIRIYAAPGYQLYIERMCHGDYQQVPVDPSEIESFVAALEVAAGYQAAGAQRAKGRKR